MWKINDLNGRIILCQDTANNLKYLCWKILILLGCHSDEYTASQIPGIESISRLKKFEENKLSKSIVFKKYYKKWIDLEKRMNYESFNKRSRKITRGVIQNVNYEKEYCIVALNIKDLTKAWFFLRVKGWVKSVQSTTLSHSQYRICSDNKINKNLIKSKALFNILLLSAEYREKGSLERFQIRIYLLFHN